MSKAALYLSTTAALLVLLAGSLVVGLAPERSNYARLSAVLREVTVSETALQRNILLVRAGLLRNYDPLVKSMDATRRFSLELCSVAVPGTSLREQADAVFKKVAEEELLLERFKTDNAQLQNSLAYFDQLSMRITIEDEDKPLVMAAGALASAMLHLTRDPSPEIKAIVETRLAKLAALASLVPDKELPGDAATLIKRGLLLNRLIPAVDSSLRALIATSSREIRLDFASQLEQVRAIDEDRAERFRLALSALAVLLLALLVIFGFQLRARAQALRRRSDIEHVLAKLSARLIDCTPEDTDAVLKDAVAILGTAFGAHRCYLVRPGKPIRCQSWQQADVWGHAGWPQTALQLLPEDARTGGVNHVADTSKLPPGPLREALAAAQVGSWIGLPLYHGTTFLGLLGFDCLRPRSHGPRDGFGLLRMAAEVLVSALHRQHVLEEQSNLELRLSRARRLEAVGTFASGIAHNFNNVIGAILGHAEMATDSLAGGTPQARHLDEISRAGERARELVAHILEYGSHRSSKRAPVLFDALLGESISLLRASFPAELRLHVEGDCDGLIVAGTAAQLQQVVVNLIRNAAEASNWHGQVEIEVAAARLVEPLRVSHGEVAAGTYVHVAVVDAGVGMDARTLAQLFEPFFTTRPSGTGLGLATVWEIVRDHDGVLDVHSIVGKGTRIEVWLPALPHDAGADMLSKPGNGQTVLILNPDDDNRYREEEVLAALGYEPVGFHTIAAALSTCQVHQDRFDAVLLDETAGVPNILMQMAMLRRAAPRCPIILVCSGTTDISARDLATCGVIAVMSRPPRSSELASALARCI